MEINVNPFRPSCETNFVQWNNNPLLEEIKIIRLFLSLLVSFSDVFWVSKFEGKPMRVATLHKDFFD